MLVVIGISIQSMSTTIVVYVAETIQHVKQLMALQISLNLDLGQLVS